MRGPHEEGVIYIPAIGFWQGQLTERNSRAAPSYHFKTLCKPHRYGVRSANAGEVTFEL